jgi:hypothetical protein
MAMQLSKTKICQSDEPAMAIRLQKKKKKKKTMMMMMKRRRSI